MLVSLSTLVASIGPFTSMDALVPLHIADLRESLCADLTGKGSLTCMDAQMAAQHLRPSERLVTDVARNSYAWPVMIALMFLQVEHVHKRFATHRAQVLALAHVISLMSPQETGVYEALAAHVALVGPGHRVVADVNGQLESGWETFLTVRALMEAYRRVALLMNLQVRTLREALATDGALVRLLPSVHPDVLDHFGFLAERFGTLCAFKRPGERMTFHVAGKKAKAAKTSATVCAMEWSLSSMCAYVCLQLALETKYLITNATGVGLVSRD